MGGMAALIPSRKDPEANERAIAAATPGDITENGLRVNVNVGFQYISYWLGGRAPRESTT